MKTESDKNVGKNQDNTHFACICIFF